MAMTGIGKRYATALFNAAIAEDVLDQVHDDVVGFARLLEAERGFARFLASQRVTADQKKDIVVRAIGDRASGLFVKFALLLIAKKRMTGFEEVAESFAALYEEHSNIVRVGITTAVPLEPELERKAKEMVERRTGKTAKLVKKIDPEIIGGMIVVAGNQIIDGSIRNQLAELRKSLLDARVN